MSAPEPVRRAHRLPHVGALDGLRAVALIAVLCYHGGFSWARGGFLGVSTFFTLSGFLITSLLLVERKDTGSVALGRFWSARVRRLLPAALVTLVIVVAFARFAATPTQLTGLRGDLLSCFALATNWRLAASGRSYGAYLTTSSPVQHIWSLAVEEQFYLVLPVLLLLVTRRSKRPQDRLAWVAGGLAVISTGFLLTSVGRDGQTTWAYYATYTRAAELLAGVVLACTAHRLVGWRYRLPVIQLAGVVGLVVLVFAWARADQQSASLYRGGLTLYTLASAAVILASLQKGPIRAVLSTAPMQWIGRLSYSAYLYHWPIFLWLTHDRVGIGGIGLFALRVALTISLAAASTAFLERPIRSRLVLPRPGFAPVAAAVALGLALVVVVPGRVVDNGPSGIAVASGEQVAAATPLHSTTTIAVAPTGPTGPVGATTTTLPPKPAVRRLLLVGDSLMHQAAPYFAERFRGVDVRWVGADGIGPLSDQGHVLDLVTNSIVAFDPDVVVMEFAGSYLKRQGGDPFVTADGRKVDDGSDLMFEAWNSQVRTLVSIARTNGAKVLWALTPVIDPNGFFSYLAPGVDRLNGIYRQLPGVGIIDWHQASEGPEGGFSSSLTDHGETAQARSPDGLHFTGFGYRLLAEVSATGIEGYDGRHLAKS